MKLVGWKRKAMRRQHREDNPLPKPRRLRTTPRSAPHRHAALYNSPTWKRLRRQQLRDYPLCAMCGQLASEVDHWRRHEGDRELFADARNLASLCRPCHQRKTAAERRGWKPE